MASPGSTSRSKTGYVKEVTAGTTPASPAIKALRVTSSLLAATPTRVTSAEIRSDRQIVDQVLTKLLTGGDLGIELSYSALDDLIAGALQSAWTNNPSFVNTGSNTPISALSTTTATVTSGGAAFLVGMLALTKGFPTAANNNILSRVSSSTGTTIVFPASSFTAEGGVIPTGATLQVVGFQGASADIVATVSGPGNGLTATALDFTTLGLNVGEWVHVGDDGAATQFATAANNGWCRVSAVTAHLLSFDIVPSGWGADSGTGKTIMVFDGDFMSNGTTTSSFTFERQQQDIAVPSYEYFTGQQVDGLSLAFKADSIVTGKVTVMGMSASATTTRAAGATDVAAPTFPVLNTSSNVGELYENNVLVTGPSYMMETSIDIKNNLGQQVAVGNISPIGVRNGEFAVTGTLTAYFGDLTLLNQVFNNNDVSLMIRTGRTDGNRESYVFDVPSMRVSGTSPVTAKSQDRMFTGTYAAKMHPTYNYMLGISRFNYLPIAS